MTGFATDAGGQVGVPEPLLSVGEHLGDERRIAEADTVHYSLASRACPTAMHGVSERLDAALYNAGTQLRPPGCKQCFEDDAVRVEIGNQGVSRSGSHDGSRKLGDLIDMGSVAGTKPFGMRNVGHWASGAVWSAAMAASIAGSTPGVSSAMDRSS